MEPVIYEKLFRLDDKVVLVTGAASGIGAETAHALCQAGASVVLTDLQAALGERTAADLRDRGYRATFMTHDVSDEAQWQQIVAAVAQHESHIDVLVNNAGIELVKAITDTDKRAFAKVLDVNVTGAFLGMKHVVPHMTHGGSIINIASASGLIGSGFLASYSASKGGLRLLAKSAAVEFARLGNGVRVNTICPGLVRTPLGNSLGEKFAKVGAVPDAAAFEAGMAMSHLLGMGEPHDVAAAVLYLASDASRWVTGADFSIDGGMTAM